MRERPFAIWQRAFLNDKSIFFLHKNLLTDAILLVMIILQSANGCA